MTDRHETLEFFARGCADGVEQQAELRFVRADATVVAVTIRCINSLSFTDVLALLDTLQERWPESEGGSLATTTHNLTGALKHALCSDSLPFAYGANWIGLLPNPYQERFALLPLPALLQQQVL